MLNKKMKYSLLISSLSCLPVTTSCQARANYLVCDMEIATHDANGWNTCINEIAHSDCPTIYLTTDAAYCLMQASLIYYTSSELSLIDGNTSEFADHIMLISFKNYQYKQGQDSKINSYNYSYWNLVGDANGQRHEYKNILEYGVKEGSHMVLTNLEDFDTDSTEYSDPNNNEYWWLNYVTTQKILEKIYSMYDQFQPNINFNFVLSDLFLNNFQIDTYNTLNLQRTMYSRANKMYFISDGSYSYSVLSRVYIQNYAKYGYVDSEYQNELWDILHSNADDTRKNNLLFHNPIAFLNNEKFCLFLGPDDGWYNTYYDKSFSLSPATMIKYAYSNINWLSYQRDFHLDDETFASLCNSIALFYDEENADKIKDGNSFISLYATDDTYQHFDSKKKNIIIPTPSYLVNDDDIRDQNIKDIFDEMAKKYSPDEYNWIFKGHPRNNEQSYYQKMKKILPDYYDNIVILKMKFPLEFLVILDWQLAKTSNTYHTVDPYSFVTDQPSGILGGWSLDTSCVITLINLLYHFSNGDGYILGCENAKKILNLDTLFLPNRFNISNGEIIDDYLDNFNILNDMYKPFVTINKFVNVNLFRPI